MNITPTFLCPNIIPLSSLIYQPTTLTPTDTNVTQLTLTSFSNLAAVALGEKWQREHVI